MTKALLVIGILAMLVFAGCTGTTAPTAEKAVEKTVVKTDASLVEATSEFVDDTDNVEIGEMI